MPDCTNTVEVTPPAAHEVQVEGPDTNVVQVTPPAIEQVQVDGPAVNQVAVVPPQVYEVQVSDRLIIERTIVVEAAQRFLKVDFAHDTSSPLFIAIQATNELITESVVCVSTAFDDVAATLALGSVGDPTLIFDTTELKPKRIAQFESDEVISAAVATTIQLVITPGTSTTGAGFVLLTLKRV